MHRKFLELSIKDPYLSSKGEMGCVSSVRTAVMNIVAFPAGVVGPGVAAKAAKTALHDLTSDKQDIKPTTEAREHKTLEKDVSKDVMDEDTADKSTTINAHPNATASTADDIPVDGPPSKPMLPTPSTQPAPLTATSAATAGTTTPLASSILCNILNSLNNTAVAASAPPKSYVAHIYRHHPIVMFGI
jgi:SWI/SNF related-matrix-associated actin-dependent regulator of chromatin subfamily C